MFSIRSSMAALAVLGAGASCHGTPAPAPTPAQTFVVAMDGIPYLRDATGGWYLVDTGAPRTVITPDAAGLAPTERGERVLPDWQLGLNPGNVPVVVSPAPAGQIAFSLLPFRGIVGVDLLQHFAVTLDPRAGRLVAASLPLELDPGAAEVGVERLGAGSFCLSDGQCAAYGPSRLVVQLVVEGVHASAVVDTGSEFTRFTTSLFRRLPPRPDRPALLLPGGAVTLTRVADLEASASGSAAASTVARNAIVATDDNEDLFAKLQVETGRPVEAVLGQSYLRGFVLQMDFASPALSLRAYEASAPPDDLDGSEVGIGATWGLTDACFTVAGVFPGHDAERQGLRAGDCIVTVDALPRQGTTLTRLLGYVHDRGPGATVHLVGQRSGTPLDWTVLVEDLLPPMR
jgi:hypothetical protein